MLKQFLGDFVNEGFNSLLIQTLMSEPIVQHAVFAVSSAQRMVLAEDTESQGVTFALDHYGKTVKQLSQALSIQSGPVKSNSLLMTCILLSCFEFLRRRYDTAFLHLRGGFTLLSSLESTEKEPGTPQSSGVGTTPSTVDNSLVDIFERLDLMRSLFTSTKVVLASRKAAKADIEQVAEPFRTTLDARAALVRWHAKLIDLNVDIDTNLNSSALVPEDLQAQARLRQTELRIAVSKWFELFNGMIQKKAGRIASHLGGKTSLSRADSILKIRGLVLIIMIDKALSGGRECDYDDSILEFERIINLADTCIHVHDRSPNSPDHSTGKKSFSLELGVMAPLLFIISHCREPALRRKAIGILLSSQHREGPWEAWQVAICASKIVKLEEKTAMMLRDGKSVICAADIPEAARLSHAYFDLDNNDNKIYRKRRLFDADGEWVFYGEEVD